MVTILTMMMISGFETQQTATFKYVHFVVCQSYLKLSKRNESTREKVRERSVQGLCTRQGLLTLSCLLALHIYTFFLFFFFGPTTRFSRSQLPNQGLNPDPGSESAESLLLGCQGTFCITILKGCILFICMDTLAIIYLINVLITGCLCFLFAFKQYKRPCTSVQFVPF